MRNLTQITHSLAALQVFALLNPEAYLLGSDADQLKDKLSRLVQTGRASSAFSMWQAASDLP